MKRILSSLLAFVILVSLTACGSVQNEQSSVTNSTSNPTATESESQETAATRPETGSEDHEDTDSEVSSETDPATQPETEQEETDFMMNIQIGEHLLTATLVQNSSTEALLEMLSEGPVTINMNDYASMEKVGPFPKSLPRNDEQISTEAGDLILYQGNSFVIYYDTNSWNFTRLGKIDNVTQQELKEILGSGSVTAVLSLPSE